MAKFYVQTGNLKRIIDSASAELAAVWAVHQAMQQIAPQFTELPKKPITRDEVVVLGDNIQISEVGFDNGDSQSIETFTAFRKWYALCELVDLQ
jgi:hypothetical protein